MGAPSIDISPPYCYFGGKRTVADEIWRRLGNVDNFIDPFFGSMSILLARPDGHKQADGWPTETVNDIDGFAANFWRADQADPDGVAAAADWPVNEVDLEARHRWLCRQPDKAEFLERMKHEPEFCDVKRAGWWVWGINAWIGTGWCAGNYYPENRQDSNGDGIVDVVRQLPHLGHGGMGVHRPGQPLREWMRALSKRLRRVRVCCGDWNRVVTNGAMAHGSIIGVVLDPPYSGEAKRDNALYRCEDLGVSHDCREWCKRYGPKKRMRIALCGYEGEHDELEALGWKVFAWKSGGGFANFAKDDEEIEGGTQGKANRGRERIWFSPHCLEPQPELKL